MIAEEEIAPFVLRHFHCLSSRRRFRPMSSREVLKVIVANALTNIEKQTSGSEKKKR